MTRCVSEPFDFIVNSSVLPMPPLVFFTNAIRLPLGDQAGSNPSPSLVRWLPSGLIV